MGEREPSRHTAYFEVLEACRKGEGCPICTLSLAAVAHYLDAIIYENVNDGPTRDAVVAARGYCNDHSWQLQEMGAALGTAIMYRDVLRHVAAALRRRPTGDRLGLFAARRQGGLLDGLGSLGGGESPGGGQTVSDPHTACPACQMRERSDLLYLAVLLEHLHEEDMAQAFRQAGGVCLVHLDQAADATHDTARLDRLLALQEDVLAALDGELSEFMRKHDYRFKDEGIGAEGDSWIRAIAMVAGQRGIR
jgi:hypothetical protein